MFRPTYAALDPASQQLARLLGPLAHPRQPSRVVDAVSRAFIRLGEGNHQLGHAELARGSLRPPGDALRVLAAAKCGTRGDPLAAESATEACRLAATARKFLERISTKVRHRA